VAGLFFGPAGLAIFVFEQAPFRPFDFCAAEHLRTNEEHRFWRHLASCQECTISSLRRPLHGLHVPGGRHGAWVGLLGFHPSEYTGTADLPPKVKPVAWRLERWSVLRRNMPIAATQQIFKLEI
jgi:hypothetical protein